MNPIPPIERKPQPADDTPSVGEEIVPSVGAEIPASEIETPQEAVSAPTVGQEIDPFSDIEVFKLWKADNPGLSTWDTVKAASAELGGQIWDTMKELPVLAARRQAIDPATRLAAEKRTVATAAEAGAEAYKGYAIMGKFLGSKGQEALAKGAKAFGADAETQKFHEEEALKAEMDFYRTTRDFTSTVNDGRVILDSAKNAAIEAINKDWATGNTFSDTEISEGTARLVSNFLDPDAFSVMGKAALKGFGRTAIRKAATVAPAEGMLHAAERDVVTAIAARADAQEALLAAKAAGADVAPLVADLGKAEQGLIEANLYLKSRLGEMERQLTPGKGTAQVATGRVIQGLGAGTEWVGKKVDDFSQWMDDRITQFGAGGGESTLRKVADTIPLVKWADTAGSVISSTGEIARLTGQYIADAESSLGYFQSLARAMPEGVGRWTASSAERLEFLATSGRWIMDSVDTTAKTTAIGAGFGALSGDATAGATQGFWFGMAGSQFGQFARMNSPEEVRARQQVDVAIAKKRRENAPGDQAKLFNESGEAMQLATATFEQAYPDLNIKFTRRGGKGGAGWYDDLGKIGQVTIDLDHPTPTAGLFTHEVKHHLGRNPEIKQAIETALLGDPNTGQAGIFTARDANGKPIVEEVVDAKNPEVTQRRFKLNAEFESYREQYLQRMRDSNLPTLEYERDPRMVAHEIWAESEAANLLGTQPNGKFDIIASKQMGPVQRLVADKVAGSNLIRNSAFMQRALAKLGVTFTSEGKATNTGLFKTPIDLPGVAKAVEKYNRMRDAERAINDDPDLREMRGYTDAEILASPQLMEMYSSGHDVVRDPVTGKMRFVSEAEAKRRGKEFSDTLKKELSAYVGREPGVVQEHLVEDSLGRVSRVWRGTNIPETVIKKMEDSGRFNEYQLANIRALNQVLKLGRGTEVNFVYQPSSKRGGKLYRTRPITERTETPMTFLISNDGNLLINTISQEKLQRNAVDAVKNGRAELWGNNFQALWADVGLYMKNHQDGLGGAANGLGEAKRDFINSLFGQLTKEQRNENPLLQDMSERKARNAGIVQSRRVDRINRMTVLSSEFKPDYGAVSRNFSPAKADAPGTKVPGTPEPKADAPGAKVTETPEFKKWFRRSAVKDENGNPQVVFHGTPVWSRDGKGLGDFTVFDPQAARKVFGRKPGMDQVGSWFSSKPGREGAGMYVSNNPENPGAMYPVYLSIQRPFMMSFPEFLELGQKLDKNWTDKNLAKKGEMPERMAPGAFDGTLVRDYLQERGWDGILFEETNIDGGDHWVWVAFEPSQIKSAIGNKGTFDPSNPDIRYSPGAHVDNIRAIDSVGNKTATQVDPASIKYAENPVKDSVVLPPRWGFVNREIVGMERSFADVDAVVTRAVERLTATANDNATFAKESARFYEDMADSSLTLSDIVSPGVKGGEQANLADLMLRYLALGSPRTDVSGNATKSSGSAASVAGGFQPGYKLGFGSQQVGAKETFAAWQKGEHFNLDMPGIDDKVRSFYVNGLSELIEKLQKSGDTEAADALMLRAGKSLHIVAPDHAKLTSAEAKEVQRHLDGKATVDMWDMAGKGYAWPGFILRKNQRNNAAQPFQWSQDKFAKKATMSDPAWATVLKDLGYTEPKDLRYQEARALRIEGNMDWSEKTWAERAKQPFAPDTQFTYFTQGTEAGLSPGGAGPMYDAQQGMDGLIADRLNELGMAPMFGKEKLKARNAQEILWAQEKLDNPIESNNDLSLYGNTFKQLAATVGELRLGQGLTKRARAEAVLGAMDRAYAAMAKQEMPFEVITSGTSPEAQRIQSKIEALRTAGDPDPVKSLTASVADGLGDTINDLSIKHGLDAFVDEINVRRGGYTEGGKAAISPNIVAILRGKPEDVRVVLDTVSRALDQDGGNIMRKPSVRELNDANVKKANVVTFDTRALGEPQREALFLELSALKDAKGETFLTGFTETSDGIAVGDQFYGGDFVAAMEQNRDAIAGILSRYQVPEAKLDRLVIDTFRRGTAPGKEAASPFAKDLADHLARKVTEAKAPGRQFPQVTDTAALLTKGAEVKVAGVGALPKSRQVAVLSQLKSDVDAALLRGQIDEQTAQRIKAAIP